MSDDRPDTRPPSGDITLLLQRWTAGDEGAANALLPKVYDELRRLAGRYLRRERPDHTLPPTGLVHEAYLRLLGTDPAAATIDNRVHFFAVAAKAMRRILVDHARRHAATRRLAPADKTSFEEAGAFDRERASFLEVLEVHDALDRLREDHPRQAEVVELRYFGGLTEPEIAEVLGVSRPTVARDWRLARLLLRRLLTTGAAG